MIFGFGDWGGAGSHGGMGLGWDRVPVGAGDVSLFINLATSQQGTHAEFIDTDRKGLMTFIGTRPFSKMKEAKWIRGLEFGLGYQANSIDSFVSRGVSVSGHEERGGQDFFEVDGVGGGWSSIWIPGMRWRIGPYMIRGNWHKTQFEGRNDGFRGVQGTGWNVSNQIFLWSPKGFLTGSPSTPGSILLGFDFERADVECGVIGCNALDDVGTHKRQTILNREMALWYWIRPSLRVGTWAHFWQTSNTPANVQVATGCKGSFDAARAGKSTSRKCDWWTWNMGIQYQW